MNEENKKLNAAVHFVCARCSDPKKLGSTKLNKILLYSDIASYIKTGETITNASYEKMPYGPVPIGIAESIASLQEEGKILVKARKTEYSPDEYISLSDNTDTSDIQDDSVSILLSVTDNIRDNHTARSISELSHDIVWDAASIGEEIPINAYMVCSPGKVQGSDIEWANEIANRAC